MKSVFFCVTLLWSVGLLPAAEAQDLHFWLPERPIPTAVWFPAAAGMIKDQIYLVGGYNSSGATVAENQIYSGYSNSWSTGTPMPALTAHAAGAGGYSPLYVFGGSQDGLTCDNAVFAYDSKKDAWSLKAAMPTARCGAVAAVKKNIIYVIGGYSNGQRLKTVEAYDPATNTWTEKAPLLVAKSEAAVGLVKTQIVAAGGYTESGVTGDNEAYDPTTDTWTAVQSDPAARKAACFGVIG